MIGRCCKLQILLWERLTLILHSHTTDLVDRRLRRWHCLINIDRVCCSSYSMQNKYTHNRTRSEPTTFPYRRFCVVRFIYCAFTKWVVLVKKQILSGTPFIQWPLQWMFQTADDRSVHWMYCDISTNWILFISILSGIVTIIYEYKLGSSHVIGFLTKSILNWSITVRLENCLKIILFLIWSCRKSIPRTVLSFKQYKWQYTLQLTIYRNISSL